MEKEFDSDAIKATQDALGKYIKRPPLTEKLLKKPPFRFLHDIITTVLKTTGLFEGLFDDNELISDNVKDRESKILFLNKVISVLSLTTGKTLSVKPSKIVAGQEPEKTNELLQCLALALDNKLSSEDAVKTFKETSKSPQIVQTRTKDSTKNSKKSNDSKQLTAKSSEKLTSRRDPIEKTVTKSEKEKLIENKNRKKENGSVKPTKLQTAKTSNKKDIPSQPNKGTKLNLVQKSNIEPKNAERPLSYKNKSELLKQEKHIETDFVKKEELRENEQLQKTNGDKKEVVIESKDNNDTNEKVNVNFSLPLTDSDINSTSPIQNTDIESSPTDINVDRQENDLKNDKLSFENLQDVAINMGSAQNNEEETESRAENNSASHIQPMNQPLKHVLTEVTSSTTIAQSNTNITIPLSVRPSSSRPGAPRLREKLDNFVTETNNGLIGKVHIITENAGTEEEEEGSLVIVESQETETLSSNDLQYEHGHLVQQILDSQKQLSQVSGKTEIEWQFGVQKAKEAQHQEIEQLRFNIQAVSRVANPLGKLLDHIQEDVEVMRQELQQWKNIYDEVSKEILKQKALNEDSLQPLRAKLKQLEIETEEKSDKICDMKILINKNATRIEKLLGGGNVQ